MYLPPGCVSLYGLGNDTGVSGLVPTNSEWKFATIYGVGDGGNAGIQVGTSVIFNPKEAKLAVKWNGWPYTIIEQARLAGTEIIPS